MNQNCIRMGGNGILSSSVGSLAPPKAFAPMTQLGAALVPPPRRAPEGVADPPAQAAMCHLCLRSYELELKKLVAEQFSRSASSKPPPQPPQMLHWLQLGTAAKAPPDSQQIPVLPLLFFLWIWIWIWIRTACD